MNTKEEVYSGKYIAHNDKMYQLVPEKEKNSCKGCALMHIATCTRKIMDNCRQGYILKHVII